MVSLPALRHGVARVDGEIEDGRFELRRIDERHRLARHVSTLSSTISPMVRATSGAMPRDQFVDLHFARLQRLLAGEGQHLAGEVGALARRADRFVSALGACGRRVQLAFEQLEIADDDGEQIVEVVGEAAGELADGFHLLGLMELGFGLCLFGHSTIWTISCSISPLLVAHDGDRGAAVHRAAIGRG